MDKILIIKISYFNNSISKSNKNASLHLEYYLRRHSRALRKAYRETIEAIIEDQVYAVDAIKLEYLFENQFRTKVSLK